MVAHVEGGYSDGGHAWSNPNLVADYTNAAATGAQWIRTDWDWWAVQETSGPIDWSRLDNLVDLCDSLSLKILPIIHIVPPWSNGGLGDYAPPNPLSQWTTFARLAALRYIPRGLLTWEVGNEPNLSHSGWTISGSYYVQNMLQPIVTGLRQAASELGVPIRIVFGGLAPSEGNPSISNAVNFLNSAYSAGAKPLFDILGWHPYTGVNSPLTANQMRLETVDLHNAMAAQGDGGKQIWATEYGWYTNGTGSVSESVLAQHVYDAAEMWSTFSYGGPLFQYSIRDRQTYAANTGDREDYFGAWRNDGTPKTGVNTALTAIFTAAATPVAGTAVLAATATLTATARRTTAAGTITLAAAATLTAAATGGVSNVTGTATLAATSTLTATATTSTTPRPPPIRPPRRRKDWLVEARSEATRTRFAPVVAWEAMVVVDRFNTPGSWQITGSIRSLRPLLGPGVGAVITRGGQQIMSGPVTRIERRGDHTAVVTGVSDLVRLADRIVYPEPGAAITAQTTDYWTAIGSTRETILLNLIRDNAGSDALTARQVAGLRVPATQSRGGFASVTARLDNLMVLTGQLAEAGGFRVDVQHTEDGTGIWLDVTLSPVADKSSWVRFGPVEAGGPGRLAPDWSYAITAPTVTRAIVAGGGQGTARVFRERPSTDAEALWGRRVETIVDQRQTSDTDELDNAGDDALTAGAGPVEISATVLDSPDLGYREDWTVGDKVAVDVDGETLVDVVREATTTVQVRSGQATETVQPTIGSQDVSAVVTPTQRQLAVALRRLAALERRL